MERFKSIRSSTHITISIEYITSHENSETCILYDDLAYGVNLEDAVVSLLSAHSINVDDVVSITTAWYKSFYNSHYDGKSFKVVGQD